MYPELRFELNPDFVYIASQKRIAHMVTRGCILNSVKEYRAYAILFDLVEGLSTEPVSIVKLVDKVRIAANLDKESAEKVIPTLALRPDNVRRMLVEEGGAPDGVSVHVQRISIPLLVPVSEGLLANETHPFPFLA